MHIYTLTYSAVGMHSTHSPQWHTHTSVNGITRAEESGCWIFPPFLCQPFISRSEGGGEWGGERYRENQRRKARERARERWSLHSPAGDRPRTFCTGVFVGEIQNTFSIPPELDLPVCLSVHSLSVGFPVCLPSHLSVTGWADVCQLICLSLYEVFKLSRVHAVEEASEVKAEERKSLRLYVRPQFNTTQVLQKPEFSPSSKNGYRGISLAQVQDLWQICEEWCRSHWCHPRSLVLLWTLTKTLCWPKGLKIKQIIIPYPKRSHILHLNTAYSQLTCRP